MGIGIVRYVLFFCASCECREGRIGILRYEQGSLFGGCTFWDGLGTGWSEGEFVVGRGASRDGAGDRNGGVRGWSLGVGVSTTADEAETDEEDEYGEEEGTEDGGEENKEGSSEVINRRWGGRDRGWWIGGRRGDCSGCGND